MKKILLYTILFLTFFIQSACAEIMPSYTNSIKHYGIGAAFISNFINIYEKPDVNSKIVQRIYWNSAGNFLLLDKSLGEEPKDIFLAFVPDENKALLSVEDEDEEWIKVCYNQKAELFGWVKKENGKQSAKFYTYRDLFFEYGKKYGIYTFRNLPKGFKVLKSAPDETSKEVDNFEYPRLISPWLIQGNWMLIKVATYDKKTKTGWFRWRSNNGRLYGFVYLK